MTERLPKEDYYELVDRIVSLEQEGIKRREIAQELGITLKRVTAILKKHAENPELVAQKEAEVWALRVQGKTHQEIAKIVDMERSSVSKMLKRLKDRAIASLDDEILAEKVLQWNRLEFIVVESFEAWETSKQADKRVTQRRSSVKPKEGSQDEGDQTPDKVSEIVTSQVVEQDGNLNFLREARAAMKDIRDLLGIEAPKKIAQTDPTGMKEAELGAQVVFYIPDNQRDGNGLPEKNED